MRLSQAHHGKEARVHRSLTTGNSEEDFADAPAGRGRYWRAIAHAQNELRTLRLFEEIADSRSQGRKRERLIEKRGPDVIGSRIQQNALEPASGSQPIKPGVAWRPENRQGRGGRRFTVRFFFLYEKGVSGARAKIGCHIDPTERAVRDAIVAGTARWPCPPRNLLAKARICPEHSIGCCNQIKQRAPCLFLPYDLKSHRFLYGKPFEDGEQRRRKRTVGERLPIRSPLEHGVEEQLLLLARFNALLEADAGEQIGLFRISVNLDVCRIAEMPDGNEEIRQRRPAADDQLPIASVNRRERPRAINIQFYRRVEYLKEPGLDVMPRWRQYRLMQQEAQFIRGRACCREIRFRYLPGI